jgi:hypothetical protein
VYSGTCEKQSNPSLRTIFAYLDHHLGWKKSGRIISSALLLMTKIFHGIQHKPCGEGMQSNFDFVQFSQSDFSCQVIGNITQSEARARMKVAFQWHSNPISFHLLRHADKQSHPFYSTFNIQQIITSHSPSQSTTIFKASRQTPH